jgi:hypothetical protein
MSAPMPMMDRFGIPDHLLGEVCFPDYVELSDDITHNNAGVAPADAGLPVDEHPHGQYVSDNDNPVEHHDKHDVEPDDEDPDPTLDSPDDSVPAEFDMDDLPRHSRDLAPSRG